MSPRSRAPGTGTGTSAPRAATTWCPKGPRPGRCSPPSGGWPLLLALPLRQLERQVQGALGLSRVLLQRLGEEPGDLDVTLLGGQELLPGARELDRELLAAGLGDRELALAQGDDLGLLLALLRRHSGGV